MRRLVMSRSTATLRDANRPSYTTVVSFKSESSGRTSPDLSSDMNGSRPPPSYAKTSRNSVCGCTAVVSTGRFVCCAPAEAVSVTSASATLATRTWCSRGGRLRSGGRSRRLHERPNREFGQQQRARGVAEQFLHGRRGGRERDVLRDDDARQRRDVGEILADLIVMPVHLEPVAIGVERRTGLRGERLNLAERDAANFGLGRDVVDQRRYFVALGHEAPHQLERALVLLHAAAQVFDAAARQIAFRRGDDPLEAIGLRVRRTDLFGVGRVLLGPEEIASRQCGEGEQQHDLAALVGG